MYRNQRIGLVIPSHNEAKLIGPTLDSVPKFVDNVFVVDDASTDTQNDVIRAKAANDPRISLIEHTQCQGPGGAIITGYRAASRSQCDITVVVGGDNQMPMEEMENFIDPIVEGEADYTKGNRFSLSHLEETMGKMPRIRFFANWLITAMTKICSGYYDVMDVVDGYTAIRRRVIDTVDWGKAWMGYGYPMDFLIRFNAYGFSVRDVPRTAIYLTGERQSQIRGLSYAMKVMPMLIRSFFWRLRFRYAYRDFHPLILFYFASLFALFLGMLGGSYLVIDKIFFDGNQVTGSKSVLVALLLLTGTQFLAFAMLQDREESKALKNNSLPNAWPMGKPLSAGRKSGEALAS